MTVLKVTCALIIQNNKIFITQNSSNSDHPFQWEFPGGKIKTGETNEDCLKREIKEELEIEVEILCELKPVIFDYEIKTIELIPFLCSFKSGKIHLNEHIDFKWLELNELKSLNFPGADLELIQLKENWDTLKEYIGE